eukprot:scaffold264_cov317-Pinguiococcus_pyrenoidosus.AAC.9
MVRIRSFPGSSPLGVPAANGASLSYPRALAATGEALGEVEVHCLRLWREIGGCGRTREDEDPLLGCAPRGNGALQGLSQPRVAAVCPAGAVGGDADGVEEGLPTAAAVRHRKGARWHMDSAAFASPSQRSGLYGVAGSPADRQRVLRGRGGQRGEYDAGELRPLRRESGWRVHWLDRLGRRRASFAVEGADGRFAREASVGRPQHAAGGS